MSSGKTIFYFRDSDIYNFLLENDYLEKSKVPPTKILSLIPKNLKYLWFRGYFDGDGCIYVGTRNSLAFWANIDYDWSFIEKVFRELKIRSSSIVKYNYKKHYSSCYETRRLNDITQFFNYIYPDKIFDFGLERKFKKLVMAFKRFTSLKPSSSRHKGVVYNKRNSKWGAFIYFPSTQKRIFLGWHNKEIEAARAIKVFSETNKISS